ncbi:Putative HTH-type transcriptional regulator [Burkholderiales bacterium]|nr:Putative HTH-type transcriptional regulator [Burkholderiales bacterium]
MTAPAGLVTFLFTDIEGSSRLWEQEPERMRPALARHDALIRGAVARHNGTVVKMLGDGVHAAFDDPLDAIAAILELQLALAEPPPDGGLALRVRSGLNCGAVERRDGDFFGSAVNRAARIMSVAHGGQVLLSRSVVALVTDRLPKEVALRDLGHVRLRDLTSPEHIFQVLHPRLRQDFPALRSLEATPNNLAQQVTSFVGRERELAEVTRLLGTTRLITLVGAGGIGKTRLAMHVAADVMGDYPDGVWFVDLAPLSDARLVPQTIASVLGVKEEAGHTVVDALAGYVKDKRILLVLDNCEHLLHACAEIATHLLRAGAQLKILAASREPLRVAGETNYPVPALAVPDPQGEFTPEQLAQYEATRLFVERATAAHRSFRVTHANAAAVADICRRLDGIPLAIELAAARVRALPVEAIAARLSDRFRLLAGGDQTALPRQQTLRALIDWSHDLLSGPERALLRRLSVFVGGWTLDAAEAVGAGGEIAAADVLDLLTHLVDKSLVAMDADASRYRLLETVREYALARLDESGDGDAARTSHLRHFVALAEAALPRLSGPDQGTWLARLDLERENLLAAHAWAARAQDGGEVGLRLAYAVGNYWFVRGQPGLGLRLSAEALARPGAQQRSLARALALFDAGWHCCHVGRYDDAHSLLEESLAIARELGDRRHSARVLQPLGMAAFGRGDRGAARAHLREAVELARETGDKRDLAGALTGLAQLHRVEGELDSAEPLYVRAVALAREIGDRESVAIGLLNLAMVSIGRGTGDRARPMLVEIVTIATEIGSKPVGQSALDVSAGYGAWLNEWERAARIYGAAEGQAVEIGLQRDPTDEAFLLPLIARAREALGAEAFERLARAGRALSYEQGIAEARAWLVCAP